jgi:O-antigen/teichoic acid export membrane protein
MRISLPAFLHRRLFEGHERSVAAKQNILELFALRGLSSVINIILVPMTLAYLDPMRYGVWITLSSILGWVSVMDIGLGNGLRNEFTRALALNERLLARQLISTTYALVAAIAAALFVVFLVCSPFLPWTAILNAPAELGGELVVLSGFVFLFLSARLVFGLIATILIADQKPALSALLEVAVNALSLAAVFILSVTVRRSLFWLGFSFSAFAALVPFAANLWYFRTRYRDLTPSLAHVEVARGYSLASTGIQFFVLQLAVIVLFASANLIISQVFGSTQVVPYNVAFKFYNVGLAVFMVLLTPFWSAFTDAYARGDIDWIRRSLRSLKRSWAILTACLVVMTVAAGHVYRLWVGTAVEVPILLSVTSALYVSIVAWSSIFAYFVNGLGKIRLQLWVALGIAVCFVPLALLLSSVPWLGSAGVVLATCLCLLPGCVIFPLQTKKLLAGTARGVWAR